MKRTFGTLVRLAALALFVLGGRAAFAARPAAGQDEGRVRSRVAADAEQGGAGQRDRDAPPAVRGDEPGRPRRRETSPAALVRRARTLYVRPTRHLDKTYLEYKLGKYRELNDWGLSLVAEERAADLVLSVEKTALNYIFTVTDPSTSVIVATGKTVAVNGLVAAENLGREIVKKLRDVRASSTPAERRRGRDDEDDDEWSQS